MSFLVNVSFSFEIISCKFFGICTRVSVVVDYYNHWMDKWATLHHLAEASQEVTPYFPFSILFLYAQLQYIQEA